MNYIKLINSQLSLEEISNLVSSPQCGAISIFVGTTRDNFQEHKVLQLEYEAYEAMATKAMSNICGDIRKKWPSVQHIAIYHRLGIVPVQEASVVIAVSSPHRAESLEAVGFTIEALKASVPIWKKEIYESDKPDEWKENSESLPDLSKRMKSEETSSLQDLHVHSTDVDPIDHIDFTPINRKLIQIKADDKEIQRRMKSFIARKREDLNVINNREFCNHNFQSEEENSCARVDALVFRRSDSKSHLRIRRVFNQRGPQIRGNDESCSAESNAVPDNHNMDPISQAHEIPSRSWNTNSETKLEDKYLPPAVEERLQNAEKHLRIEGPISKDVYVRLQKIEARILYLEGLSPEYATFWVTQGMNRHPDTYKTRKKKTYTVDDLENKILQYQKKTI